MGSCAAPSAKGDDKFITTDYLQQCPSLRLGTLRGQGAKKVKMYSPG
ncbi:large terminase, partial [Salmonella enterica subsp. enterica serovar Enteritidis]|nr:large terminase [Salmonella enterica subsp. enterica serovar Enteritidis]